MDKGGYLEYKCRKCQKVYHNAHVPQGHLTLLCILKGLDFPKDWFGFVGKPTNYQTDIHTCNKKDMGVADLIGVIVDD